MTELEWLSAKLRMARQWYKMQEIVEATNINTRTISRVLQGADCLYSTGKEIEMWLELLPEDIKIVIDFKTGSDMATLAMIYRRSMEEIEEVIRGRKIAT